VGTREESCVTRRIRPFVPNHAMRFWVVNIAAGALVVSVSRVDYTSPAETTVVAFLFVVMNALTNVTNALHVHGRVKTHANTASVLNDAASFVHHVASHATGDVSIIGVQISAVSPATDRRVISPVGKDSSAVMTALGFAVNPARQIVEFVIDKKSLRSSLVMKMNLVQGL